MKRAGLLQQVGSDLAGSHLVLLVKMHCRPLAKSGRIVVVHSLRVTKGLREDAISMSDLVGEGSEGGKRAARSKEDEMRGREGGSEDKRQDESGEN